MTLRACGHSLIELMVVLAVAAVLLGLGIPGFQSIIARAQLRTTLNDLHAAIDLTRAQAISRGRRVTLMPAEPGSAGWSRGWVVFVDQNGNQKLDPADQLIFRQGPVHAGISITSVFSSGPGSVYLAYNGAGRSCSASSSMAAHFGTLSLFQGKEIRRIKINMLGRARTCDPALQPDTCTGATAGP